jgi:hypothetical protein
MRAIVALTCLVSSIFFQESGDKGHSNPSFDYEVARGHEIKPRRRSIPLKGNRPGLISFVSRLSCLPLETWRARTPAARRKY